MRIRRGFTLIELLIVVVIIGILAAIAIPKFRSTRDRAYSARMKSDLRNFTQAQESYFYTNSVYASDPSVLTPTFVPSTGTTLEVIEATDGGWSAKSVSTATPTICAIYYGSAAAVAPATREGVIACEE